MFPQKYFFRVMSVSESDVPPRLMSQSLPSTNTLVLTARVSVDNVQNEIYRLLCSEASQIQCLDFSEFELKRQIRATFFDVRDTWRAFLALQHEARFALQLDLEAGTNRSVVFPRGGLSLDLIHSRMAEFGQVEKLWLGMCIPNFDRDNVVIDFFDSRAPLAIVRRLEQQASSLVSPPFDSTNILSL